MEVTQSVAAPGDTNPSDATGDGTLPNLMRKRIVEIVKIAYIQVYARNITTCRPRLYHRLISKSTYMLSVRSTEKRS